MLFYLEASEPPWELERVNLGGCYTDSGCNEVGLIKE